MSKHWSDAEFKLAMELIERGASDGECLAAVGRKRHACYMKAYRWKLDPHEKTFRKPKVENTLNIPDFVWEEAARRLSAPKTITALICGDPPKGYSALERRA